MDTFPAQEMEVEGGRGSGGAAATATEAAAAAGGGMTLPVGWVGGEAQQPGDGGKKEQQEQQEQQQEEQEEEESIAEVKNSPSRKRKAEVEQQELEEDEGQDVDDPAREAVRAAASEMNAAVPPDERAWLAIVVGNTRLHWMLFKGYEYQRSWSTKHIVFEADKHIPGVHFDIFFASELQQQGGPRPHSASSSSSSSAAAAASANGASSTPATAVAAAAAAAAAVGQTNGDAEATCGAHSSVLRPITMAADFEPKRELLYMPSKMFTQQALNLLPMLLQENGPPLTVNLLGSHQGQIRVLEHWWNKHGVVVDVLQEKLIPSELVRFSAGAAYDELGVDRALAVRGAMVEHGPQVLLIDAGTCITVTATNADGEVLGGSILPGITLACKALAGNTGLPDVSRKFMYVKDDVKAAPTTLAMGTEDNILHGVYNMYHGALRHFCRSWVQQVKARAEAAKTETERDRELEAKIVITGGDASLVNNMAHSMRGLDFRVEKMPTAVAKGLLWWYIQQTCNYRPDNGPGFIGCKVRKEFSDGFHVGTVIGYTPAESMKGESTSYWNILYDDNDVEDLELAELKSTMKAFRKNEIKQQQRENRKGKGQRGNKHRRAQESDDDDDDDAESSDGEVEKEEESDGVIEEVG